MNKSKLVVFTGFLTLLGSRTALTQIAPNGSDGVGLQSGTRILEDIVVTAQRRSESLQDVPIAVTALRQDALDNAGISNSLDIANLVPSMKIKTFGGRPNVYIRGVGLTDFAFHSISPINMYRDGVVVSNGGAQAFPLFDLEQVEVLRGPQGTLFGKNTTGGAIIFRSQMPGDEFEGYGSIDYGRYDLVQIESGVTIPLSDGLSVRLSGYMQRRDGDNLNLHTNSKVGELDRRAGRIVLRYEPNERIDATIIAGISRDRSDFPTAKPLGLLPGGVDFLGYRDPVPGDPHILNYELDTKKRLNDKYISANLGFHFGDWQIRSITGYDRSSAEIRGDFDGSPGNLDDLLNGPVKAEEFSQELQFLYSGLRHKALVGLYYGESDMHDATSLVLFQDIPAFTTPVLYDINASPKTYAIFAQDAYDVTDRLTATVGLRYSWDNYRGNHTAYFLSGIRTPQQEISGVFMPYMEGKAKFSYLSWRGALDYEITDDVRAYVSASRGSKSGLYDFSIVFDPNGRTLVDPEKLTAYEAGLKMELANRRVRLNLAAYHYDYEDIQVVSVSPQIAGGLPTTALRNAASAKVQGIEAEALAVLTTDLSLTMGVGIMEAKYKAFPNGAADPVTGDLVSYTGNRLPNAPKFTFNAAVDYTVPITNDYMARAHVGYSYLGKQYFNSAQNELISSGDGYGLLNARIGIGDVADRWEFSVWGKNLANKKHITEVTDWSFEGAVGRYFGEMRTFGINLTYKFGS